MALLIWGMPTALCMLAQCVFLQCVFLQCLFPQWGTNNSCFANQEPEWVEIFDGKSLKGWVQRGGKARYVVENGMVIGKTVPNTPNSFLCTEKTYGDFELELDFKVNPELNSGVQIRSNSLPDYKNGRVHGYQVEIDPSDRAWTGGIYDESRRGWLNSLQENNKARYAFRQNQWNHFRILATGNRIQTWINDVPAADLSDDKTARGFIALQVHGVGGRKDEITVRWKNIRLRENPKTPKVADANLLEKSPAKIFSSDATVIKLADGFRFTEGPALGPDGRIYFNDIPNSLTHVHDPKTGKTTIFRKETGGANGLFWTANDALISCEGKNRQVTRLTPAGQVVLADHYQNKKLNSPNDLVLDNVGGIYFTDPRYGNRDDMELDIEGVYYINRGGKITRVITDLQRPNGLIFSPDQKTLYVADQAGGKTYSYVVSGGGALTKPKLFANVGSDGMTVDIFGNLYVTWQGAVIVFNSSGNEIDRIRPPESPANCLLVNDTLYITARTGFYSVKTNAKGVQ